MPTKSDFISKPYEDVRSHFIDRLKERYGISMTESEYDSLTPDDYNYVFKRKSSTLCYFYFKGHKVWVLYNRSRNRLTTVYFPNIEDNEEQFLLCCFNKNLWKLVDVIRRTILQDIKRFDEKCYSSKEDAAKDFFSNSPFANLLIDKYDY